MPRHFTISYSRSCLGHSSYRGETHTRRPLQPADTLIHCAETLPLSMQKPLVSGSGEALLHGAGLVIQGIELGEVELERGRNSKTYRHRLRAGMDRFLTFLESKQVGPAWYQNPTLANQLLVDCISDMHDNKVAICHARHVILAVQTCHRHLKGSLGRAWDCLRSWQLKLPTWSRIPIPILVLRSMFATALTCAIQEPAHCCHWFVFAILIRIGCSGLLRLGELMKLTAADVRVPQSSWEPQAVVLRFTEPKNKSCLGRFQFTSIHDGGIVAWLRWLTAGMEPTARLWPGSQALFPNVWQLCVGKLACESLGNYTRISASAWRNSSFPTTSEYSIAQDCRPLASRFIARTLHSACHVAPMFVSAIRSCSRSRCRTGSRH